MSQITRCPACGTTFKVVADQLRISDGWVRCGQCKDVFDASAHLLPSGPARRGAPPPPPPSQAAAPAPAAAPASSIPSTSPAASAASERTAPSPATQVRAAAPDMPPAQPAHAPPPPAQPAPPAVLPRGFPLPPEASPLSAGAPGTLPDAPHVPAFLERRREAATRSLAADASERAWSLEPVSPLAWRVRPPGSPAAAPAPAPDPLVGYELPFAELRDSGWPEEFDTDGAGLREEGPAMPPAGRSGASEAAGRDGAAHAEEGGPPPPTPADDALEQELARELAHEGVDVDTDPVDVATQAMPLAADAAMPEDAPVPAPSVWRSARNAANARATPGTPPQRAPGRRPRQDEDGADDDGDDGHGDADSDEPGFVRAARRRAWWRRPAVRIALGLAGVLLLGVLLLQVALQERDRLASQYPAIRPLLQVLCAPLQCRIDPPRRITDVVIDSSSFNKARGDGYVLAVTLRSRADFPVATPALELTLTDAQEQPVLRRVLTPQDLNAPIELPAGGDWGGSWPVSVAGAAAPRVAGYRLLAFYP